MIVRVCFLLHPWREKIRGQAVKHLKRFLRDGNNDSDSTHGQEFRSDCFGFLHSELLYLSVGGESQVVSISVDYSEHSALNNADGWFPFFIVYPLVYLIKGEER